MTRSRLASAAASVSRCLKRLRSRETRRAAVNLKQRSEAVVFEFEEPIGVVAVSARAADLDKEKERGEFGRRRRPAQTRGSGGVSAGKGRPACKADPRTTMTLTDEKLVSLTIVCPFSVKPLSQLNNLDAPAPLIFTIKLFH